MARSALLILLLVCNATFCYCQGTFGLEKNKKRDKIRFELVNNLIILPVELNGVKLSFLLDTGVNTTVLLNLEGTDSLELKDAQKINLRGLGGEELIEAYRSDNNSFRIGKASSEDLTLYLILDQEVNFSPRLGVPVHGIIGFDFLQDFVVEINYSRKFIRIHDPARFSKKLRRYEEIPLLFYKNKPYIKSLIEMEGEETENTLLIDNGLGDAVWLFHQNGDLSPPDNSFDDFLGLGLLGEVTGKRARITSLKVGENELRAVTTAFPDSASVQGLKLFEERNGSVGAEVLRRFNIVLDYGNQKIYMRKNTNFDDPFEYDMSGIILEHSGFMVVETLEKVLDPDNNEEGTPAYTSMVKYLRTFDLKPEYRIAQIRTGSPAEKAGLEVGDVIQKVNGRKAHRYDLEDLSSLLSSGDGKRIKMVVERGEEVMEYSFLLEKML